LCFFNSFRCGGALTPAGADSAFVRSPALRAGCIAAFWHLLVGLFRVVVVPTRRRGSVFPLTIANSTKVSLMCKERIMKDIPIIPRKVFFGNPDKASVQISPDGAFIAYLAPRDGVLNVWVAPRADLEVAQPITHDTGRGIRFYMWAYTSKHILYIQDQGGDENWRLFSVDVASTQSKDLTPFDSVQTQFKQASPDFPEEIVIGLNNRVPELHDIYRVNIVSGELTLLEENDGYLDYNVDDDYQLRLAHKMLPDGGVAIFKLDQEHGWETWDTVPGEDMLTTGTIGFDKYGHQIFMKDSRGRNTSAVVACNLDDKEMTLLAVNELADAQDVLQHPAEKHIQAVSFIYERKQWQILDKSIEADFAYLHTIADDDLEIVSRTHDDQFWVVRYLVDDGPVRFYLYDRQRGIADFLFTNRKDLEGQPLVKMHSEVIKSRDGLDLVVYYSLPLDSADLGDKVPHHPVPMVLIPHGGPWGRDFWGYDPLHQWLANRGYAVMFVNFRSSTGFGKAFTNAGDFEWGGKIIEDQVDAVQWAISKGIADPERVAIMGGSFGGYSTLAGLTFFAEVYACGVDIVGPSNLITLLESVPPYWKPMLELFTERVGDHRTEEGRALLAEHSPLTYVDRICRPLLIGQGANDPRVKQAESDQIVQAMKAKNIPVTYVLYPDEGHGFARPENKMSFHAIAEAFLSNSLGGRY
jgi:dipeptidyl aminopeptidase/acylaminoacyl peptidase